MDGFYVIRVKNPDRSLPMFTYAQDRRDSLILRKEVSVAWNIRNIDLGCLNIAFLVSWHSTLQRKPRLERLSGTSRLRRPERISDVPLAGWMKRIISRGPISRIRASLTRIDVVQRGWNALGGIRVLRLISD